MKKLWLVLVVLPGTLLIRLPAASKQIVEQGYQAATVVSVKRYEAVSNYLGENPVDAPLQAREYAYDIGIRLACNVYVGRYESATNYIPTALAVNHPVDVRLRKHVLYVSLPGNDWDIKLGIVNHRQVKDADCDNGLDRF
jgi:hypothetical protein